MGNLSISKKLVILIVGSLILLSAIILTVSFFKNMYNYETEKLEQLKSVVYAKKQHISDYFNSIEGLIVSTANSQTTQMALESMSKNFYEITQESNQANFINKIKNEMLLHYDRFYVKDINFSLSNIETKKATSSYLPRSTDGLLAQYIYI